MAFLTARDQKVIDFMNKESEKVKVGDFDSDKDMLLYLRGFSDAQKLYVKFSNYHNS